MKSNVNDVLTLKIDDIKKPFTSIDITNYDTLYIDGYEFPLSDNVCEKELKEPLSIESLLNRIREQEVIIDTSEEEEAKKFIFQTNYYKLSIFIRYLGEDKSFKKLSDLYYFDAQMADRLISLIRPIEIYLKASLANYLSVNYYELTKSEEIEQKHPSLAYLDYSLYKKRHKNNGDLTTLLSNISYELISRRKDELSIKHHIDNYGGNIPIWVLVDHLSMGTFSRIVLYLEKKIIKSWVRDCVEKSWQEAIYGWINTVRFIRNTCAHNSRLYGRYFSYSPKLPSEEFKKFDYDYAEYQEDVSEHVIQKTLFSGLLIIRMFYHSLSQYDKSNWNSFISWIGEQIEANRDIKIQNMGFPKNWYELLFIIEETTTS